MTDESHCQINQLLERGQSFIALVIAAVKMLLVPDDGKQCLELPCFTTCGFGDTLYALCYVLAKSVFASTILYFFSCRSSFCRRTMYTKSKSCLFPSGS